MKEKLKKHFLAYGPRRFVVCATLALLILDLLNGYYLKLWWVHKDASSRIVHGVLNAKQMSANEFNTDTVQEVLQLADNAFYFFLYIILINNLFFYFFYLRKKLWAQSFVLVYTLSAAFFNLTFIAEGPILGTGWFVFNLSTILIYGYLFLGVKLLKLETTTIPVGGKKGR